MEKNSLEASIEKRGLSDIWSNGTFSTDIKNRQLNGCRFSRIVNLIQYRTEYKQV